MTKECRSVAQAHFGDNKPIIWLYLPLDQQQHRPMLIFVDFISLVDRLYIRFGVGLINHLEKLNGLILFSVIEYLCISFWTVDPDPRPDDFVCITGRNHIIIQLVTI